MTSLLPKGLPLNSISSKAPAIVLAAYWIALVVGTHLPAERVPNTFSAIDKTIHLVAYAGLAILLSITLYRMMPVKAWAGYLFVGLTVFGALDEYTQGFVGRIPDVLDWAADVLGIAVGLGVFLIAASWWQSRESLHPNVTKS